MALMIIGEDVGHAGVIARLIQRTLSEVAVAHHATWFLDTLDTTLQWVGVIELAALHVLIPGLSYTKINQAKQRGRAFGQTATIGGKTIKLRGHFSGRAKAPEASLWRRVLIWSFANEFDQPVDALIIARDTDGDVTKLDGLQQAIDEMPPGMPILIAAPHQDLESWLVLGFRPADSTEKKWLAEIIQKLSFDPTKQPERLTASPNEALTDAKRVLRQLVDGINRSKAISREDADLLERCLPDRAHIQRCGRPCGLAAFIDEVESKLSVVFQLRKPSL